MDSILTYLNKTQGFFHNQNFIEKPTENRRSLLNTLQNQTSLHHLGRVTELIRLSVREHKTRKLLDH
jgi:hypothetical protein